MRIKFHQLKSEYDFVIVGAGIVGITIATELVQKGNANILLLEAGSDHSIDPYPQIQKVFSNGSIKRKSTFVGLGGGSNVWGTISGLLDKERVNDYYKRGLFPINYSQYLEYVKLTAKYGFPSYEIFEDRTQTSGTIRTKKFVKKIPNVLFKNNCTVIEGSNVDYIANVRAEKIVEGKLNIVSRNEVRLISSKRIILCANTLQNISILSSSNISDIAATLGRKFMNHPKGVIGSIRINEEIKRFMPNYTSSLVTYLGLQSCSIKSNHYLKVSPGFRIPVVRLWISKLEGGALFYNGSYVGQSEFLLIAYLRLIVLRCLLILEKICSKLFKEYAHLEAFTETFPRDENYVDLNMIKSNLYVRFELDDAEVKDLRVLISEFQETFKTRVLFYPRPKRLKRFVKNDASHHMGGIVCGEDVSNSVVDKSFRVHGTDNIFVCGGGVFPFSDVVNPTLSYVALSIWFVENLTQGDY